MVLSIYGWMISGDCEDERQIIINPGTLIIYLCEWNNLLANESYAKYISLLVVNSFLCAV